MSELLTFRSLQKLRFFLAGVFPFLARAPRLGETPPKWLERYPRISKWWKPLRESVVSANAQRVATTFALGNYSDKSLDWTKIPSGTASVLRAVIILGALLCLMLPLAIKVAWPPLPQESITGVAGAPVAGWSVWLWMAAFALGWSCALAGTGAASRVALIPTLVLFVYFGVVTVAALPKSWWNLLIAAQAAVAVVYCESRRIRVRRSDTFRGVIASVIAGVTLTFALIVATPMTGWFRGHLVAAVAALGAVLGVLLWWAGSKLREQAARHAGWPLVRPDAVVATLAAAYLALLISLVLRGGLVAPAQGISSFAISVTGYLWPFYYFLGIGVVFKVLRQTKAVHGVAYELIPARYFVPLCLTLLIATTSLAWSEAVVARPAIPWPAWLGAAAHGLYGASAWLWERPILGLTLGPMKWVLLAALCIATWAVIKRRFNSGVAAGILFTVLLLWLGLFEYNFEYSGFGRSYQHTALSLLIFSAFVLWLTHRTLFDFLTGASPWWPQAARIMLYSAGVLFVLLPLHARAAMHDATLPNEIFLYLFFGVIDLGLPYYLYVYAQRRFKELPLSVPAMLGVFGIGAALSVPLIVLDKLAVAEWSAAAMWQRATAQAAGLLQGQPLPVTQVFLPPGWIVARGALAMGAVVIVAALIRRYARSVRLATAAVIFSAVAAGAGLASFSNRSVELPLLPLRIAQLITPLNTSLTVDASLVARHLSYLLPAMIIGLVLSTTRGRGRLGLGLVAAFAVHIGIGLLWPAREAWLRSTGALVLVGAAGVVSFLWVTATLRERLDRELEPNAPPVAHANDSGRLLLASELRWACVAILAVLGAASVYRAYSGRVVQYSIASLHGSATLPVNWRPMTSPSVITPAPSLALITTSNSSVKPILWADTRPLEVGQARALLQNVAMETAQHLAEYTPVKLEPWDQYFPGGLALDFRYALTPGDSGTTAFGTTALAPLPNGQAFVATVIYGASDAERRWDLARALLALPRPAASRASEPLR